MTIERDSMNLQIDYTVVCNVDHTRDGSKPCGHDLDLFYYRVNDRVARWAGICHFCRTTYARVSPEGW